MVNFKIDKKEAQMGKGWINGQIYVKHIKILM